MAISPNTSATRKTNVSVESPDVAGSVGKKGVDVAADKGAERANNRINTDKGNVPGTQIFTK